MNEYGDIWQEPTLFDQQADEVWPAEYCENAECGNELAFDDVQAGDGLCSFCAYSEQYSWQT
jgi:hypothetical protein